MVYLCIAIGIIVLYFLVEIRKINNKQTELNNKLDMVLADFQAPIDRINTALANVGTELSNLNASLTSKMSDTDEATLLSELNSIASGLEALVTPPVTA